MQFSELTPEAKKDKLLIFRLIRFLNDGNFPCSYDLGFPFSSNDYFSSYKWRVNLHESKIIESRFIYYQQLISKPRKARRNVCKKKYGKYFNAELVFEPDMSSFYAKVCRTNGYKWRKEQCDKRLSKWRKFNKIKIESKAEAELVSERIASASETFRMYEAVKPRELISNKRIHLLSDNINSKSKSICLLMKGVLNWASGSMPSGHSFYSPHKFPLESPACSSTSGLSLRLHIAGF